MGACLSTPNASLQYVESDPQTVFNLGIEARNKKERDLALKYFKEAISLNPEFDRAYLYAGLICRALGNTEEAIKYYEKVLQYNKHNLRVNYNLAYAQNLLDNQSHNRPLDTISPKFSKVIDIVLRAEPKSTDDYIAKSAAYNDLGDREKEAEMLEKSLELEPNAIEYCSLGKLYSDIGRIDKAKEAYKHAIDLNPQDGDIWGNVGDFLGECGDFDGALEAAIKYVKYSPNEANAYHNLATAYRDKGSYDEAITNYEEAVKIDPTHPLFYCALGEVLYKRNTPGDEAKAIEALNKAFDLYKDPANHRGLEAGHHLYMEGIFSEERAQLLQKLSTLTETKVEVLLESESNASKKELEEYNKKVVAVVAEKKALAIESFEILGPKSNASTEVVNDVNDRLDKLTAMIFELTKANIELKKEVTILKATTVKSEEIKFTIAVNQVLIRIEREITPYNDPDTGGKAAYYKSLSFTFSCAFNAYSNLLNEVVSFKTDTSNIAITAASAAIQSVPVPGANIVAGLMKAGYSAYQTSLLEKAARNYTKVASWPGEYGELMMRVSMEITLNAGTGYKIDNSNVKVRAGGFWGTCIERLGEFGDILKTKLEGDKFDYPAGKLGCNDALTIIHEMCADNGKIKLPFASVESFIGECLGALGLTPDAEMA